MRYGLYIIFMYLLFPSIFFRSQIVVAEAADALKAMVPGEQYFISAIVTLEPKVSTYCM